MTWFKVDDGFHDHRKVRQIDYDPPAIAMWVLAGSWVGQTRSNGFVPSAVLKRWSRRWKRTAETLELAGLWEAAIVDGETGWLFHDWADWNPVREEIENDLERRRWRRKRALSKDTSLRDRIVQRDGSLCRYCGCRVSFTDRRSAKGRTFDHVDPDGENTFENVVVACRGCNGRKRDRTPEEAGMPLLDVPERAGHEPVRGLVPDLSRRRVNSECAVESGANSTCDPVHETGRDLGRIRVGFERDGELSCGERLDRAVLDGNGSALRIVDSGEDAAENRSGGGARGLH